MSWKLLKVWLFIVCASMLHLTESQDLQQYVNFDTARGALKVEVSELRGLQTVIFALQPDNECPKIIDLRDYDEHNLNFEDAYKFLIKNNQRVEIGVMIKIDNSCYVLNRKAIIEHNDPHVQNHILSNNRLSSCSLAEFKQLLGFRSCTASNSDSTNIAAASARAPAIAPSFSALPTAATTPTATATPSPAAAATPSASAASCAQALIFDDEFAANEIDSSKWNVIQRILLNDFLSEEFVLMTDSRNNLFVENNRLHIKPTLSNGDIRTGSISLGDSCSRIERAVDCELVIEGQKSNKVLPPINSGMINTKDKFTFHEGRIEIRAKLPQGDWILPYLLLQPVKPDRNVYFPSQIRIAFALGNAEYLDWRSTDMGGKHLFGGLVTWSDFHRTENFKNLRGTQHFGEQFHVYAMNLTDSELTLEVDGQIYGQIRNIDRNLLDGGFYIQLAVSAGGHIEFNDAEGTQAEKNNKPWNNTAPLAARHFWRKRNSWLPSWNGQETMQIDYVRVYGTAKQCR